MNAKTNPRKRGLRQSALTLLFAGFLLSGCSGATGDVSAKDPVERGLSYVAAAIVTNAVLRGFFNK